MSSTVPRGLDASAQWAWRFLVIVAAGWVVAQGVKMLSVVVIPITVAVLLAALMAPAVDRVHRGKTGRGPATALVVVGGLTLVVSGLVLIGQQIVRGFDDLSTQVIAGLEEIQSWIKQGPLNLTDAQLNSLIERLQEIVSASNTQLVQTASEIGTTVGHVVAGFFIVLFAVFFFLYEGDRIWAWMVRLFPRDLRSRADSSGQVAWGSLKSFVRATVVVAFVDAVGITLVAVLLDVPLAVPIGVLVFLGAFVPIVGATVSGAVAVLVALVAQGPVVALVMLAGVVLVQQIESQLLQPFLMGRAVAVHPLAVILGITAGILVAGIIGALLAVPLIASLNSVAHHLAGGAQQAEPGPVATADPSPEPDVARESGDSAPDDQS
jgi:putative heme transporter